MTKSKHQVLVLSVTITTLIVIHTHYQIITTCNCHEHVLISFHHWILFNKTPLPME